MQGGILASLPYLPYLPLPRALRHRKARFLQHGTVLRARAYRLVTFPLVGFSPTCQQGVPRAPAGRKRRRKPRRTVASCFFGRISRHEGSRLQFLLLLKDAAAMPHADHEGRDLALTASSRRTTRTLSSLLAQAPQTLSQVSRLLAPARTGQPRAPKIS